MLQLDCTKSVIRYIRHRIQGVGGGGSVGIVALVWEVSICKCAYGLVEVCSDVWLGVQGYIQKYGFRVEVGMRYVLNLAVWPLCG